ncbi:MAG TPA: hypothetical protein VM029_18250, partial [Opitutaceae bacterium]|nr:hypothetical protein [Opitutaceae bacterium]
MIRPSPQTIAIDLTPVLPGGENGGAKVFALELVRRMATIAPATRFVLLTQAASHDELASLDNDNVRRVQVLGGARSTLRSQAFGIARAALSVFPARVQRLAARGGYALNALLKRGGGSGLLKD